MVSHEGIRGINGTSFDGNIVVTTTDGFVDLGSWHRIRESGRDSSSVPLPATVHTADTPAPPSMALDPSVEVVDTLGADALTDDTPLAIYMDQQIEDHDLGDLLTAAHRGYSGTRSRNTEPLVAMTDKSTFTFHEAIGSASSTHGGATSTRDRNGGYGGAMLHNKTPKNLLATSVKGGFMGSLHRSVTGGHQSLSYTQQFNAMGGEARKTG